jgi:hypothetical protein
MVSAEVSAVTCGFVVAVPDGRRLGDPVVNPHEVSVFRELGDDLFSAHPMSLTRDRRDGHEALLRGGVYPSLDLVEGLCEVADGEVVSNTSTPFVPLLVAFTSGGSVLVGLIRRCVGRL